MEEWLSLLFRVALPVFKSLVYAGTSSLLNELQDEFQNEQNRQTKLIFNYLGIGSKVKFKKDSSDLQKISPASDRTVIEVRDIFQEITSSSLDFQQNLRQKELQQQLVTQKREQLTQLAAYQRQTTLLLPQVQNIFDNWPLKLFPLQLLESRSKEPVPLLIFIAPLKGLESEIKTEEIESILSQKLREFLFQNYPLHDKIRPTEFLGGAWETKNSNGEISIKALFGMLKSEPTLVLESEVEGDFIDFRIGYWGLGQERYYYRTVFKFSYKEFLKESVKGRARKWKETQKLLLKLGKNLEEIKKLGKENIINLSLLEEVEELEAAGIDVEDLEINYRVERKDFENLVDFLGVCHCIIAAWVADIHYLVHFDLSPLFPQVLSQLIGEVADRKLLEQAIGTTMSIYREVFQVLAKDRPDWMPELALKLAKSSIGLSDRSLAIEQINYSVEIWLQQRQLSSLVELEKIQNNLTEQDREYLQILKTCLGQLKDESAAASIQNLLIAIAQPQNQPQPSQQKIFTLSHTYNRQSELTALAIDPQTQNPIGIDGNNCIEVWNLTDSKPTAIGKLKLNLEEVSIFSFSPDGQTLASSNCADGRSYIKIWNASTGKLQKTLFGHKKPILSLAFSPDGQTLASGSHKIKLWNLKTGESFQTLFGHKESVHCLAITADGKTLISGSEDKTIRIWDVNSGELKHTLTGHQGCIKAVAIARDKQIAISGSEDKTIKLWSLESGKLLHTLTEHSGSAIEIAISPDLDYFISASADKTIKVWDLNERQSIQTLSAHSRDISAIAISQDGRIIVSASLDKTIKIWRAIGD